jgi:hypothetical protein
MGIFGCFKDKLLRGERVGGWVYTQQAFRCRLSCLFIEKKRCVKHVVNRRSTGQIQHAEKLHVRRENVSISGECWPKT